LKYTFPLSLMPAEACLYEVFCPLTSLWPLELLEKVPKVPPLFALGACGGTLMLPEKWLLMYFQKNTHSRTSLFNYVIASLH